MTRSRRPHLARIVALLCFALLTCVGSTGAASAGASAAGGGYIAFTFVPQRAYQDATAAVVVDVRPKGVSCSLRVRYADGGRQRGLERVRAANGVASWRWHVSTSSAAGPAKVTAVCGRRSASRTIVVVGSVIPVRIDVVKQGFSIRPQSYGGGTTVSYGLILRNTSGSHDAEQVSVLVNFVDSHNVLFGSATTLVDEIPAGSTYALGGELSFPGGAPVDRLEAVVQVAARSKSPSPHPTLANLRVLPSPYDHGYVGSVEGELVNDQPSLLLQRANLSVVVFDASGNVLGGGTGYAFASLPPGGREFIKITSGLSAIPIERAAMAQVSVLATYQRLR